MSPAMQKVASAAERVARVAITAFIGVLVTTGGDLADLTVLKAAVSAGIAAGLEALLSLLGGNVGNKQTPSLLPAKLDPATVPLVQSEPISPAPAAVDHHLGLSGPHGHWPTGMASEITLPPTEGADAVMVPAAGTHPQYKLGRRLNHDPASREYALPEPEATATYKAVRWTRRAPVFNQGSVGSCTGNAAAGWLGTDDASWQGLTKLGDGTPVDEALAVSIYAAAEQLDGDGTVKVKQTGAEAFTVTPDDGSSGLSVAKVLKARGLCSGYLHAFSAAATYAALQNGPGMAGIEWLNSMFDTEADGHIIVTPSSGVAGSHEFIVDEVEVDAQGNVTKVWMTNSWGESWGVGGRGYFTAAEWVGRLKANGDFTVPDPVLAPQPAPTPPAPPTPAPVTDASFQVALDAVPGLDAWLAKQAPLHKNLDGSPMSVPQYLASLARGRARL